MTETVKHPLFELRYGPLVVNSIPVYAEPGSPLDDEYDAMRARYTQITENVWHLHGVDYTNDWPECDVIAYGHDHGGNIPEDDVEAAQIWASRFISASTDYHVKEWRGLVPVLVEIRHRLVIELTTTRNVQIEVSERDAIQIMKAFASPDYLLPDAFGRQVAATRDTITYQYPDEGDGESRAVRINLNHVVAIYQTVWTRPVERLV
jgi:hypothetical protein